MSSMLSSADRKFMMDAAQGDMAEIQISQMVMGKTSNEDVKRVAQMIVDGHTKTSAELKTIAASKNVTLPTDMSSKHKAMMSRLENLSGEALDKAYITGQLSDHKAMIQKFQKESNSGRDAEVKAFAAKFLPDIQDHTKMIEEVNGKMGGKMMSGGSKSSTR